MVWERVSWRKIRFVAVPRTRRGLGGREIIERRGALRGVEVTGSVDWEKRSWVWRWVERDAE
jgi:hypothetical protein